MEQRTHARPDECGEKQGHADGGRDCQDGRDQADGIESTGWMARPAAPSRRLRALAGLAILEVHFGDVALLVVELGPDDRPAGGQRTRHVEDALVSGSAELQEGVVLVLEVAAVDEDVDELQQF